MEALGEAALLTGSAPVSGLGEYWQTVASYTRGRGRLSCAPGGYQECHNGEEVIERLAYDPEADLDNSPDSVFCGHGAGFTVKWDQVPDYAHASSGVDLEVQEEAEPQLISRQRDADAKAYEAIKEAEARKAEAEALRFAMEQEAEGIRAKGLAEAEAIEKKAEAQKKMGEASVLEMYLDALPEVVKNAAAPLAQTDRIVMYGDGNSTKLVKDVMSSASQVMDGVKESTGLDLTALLAGVVGGKMAASQPVTLEVKTGGASEAKAASKPEEAPESEV